MRKMSGIPGDVDEQPARRSAVAHISIELNHWV
jgi:hypothetical protein